MMIPRVRKRKHRPHKGQGTPDSAGVSQEDLLSFLEDPASYPHHPESVEIIQTHASYIAIAGPYVYKVKKPVDFGFLNFSTRPRMHAPHSPVIDSPMW